MSTVGEPGVQGDVVAGMHGCGVNTPNAAAVAAATCGFAGLMHMPNEEMFAIGLKSMIVAAGCDITVTRVTGRTVSGDGVVPIAHLIIAPLPTTPPAMASVYSRGPPRRQLFFSRQPRSNGKRHAFGAIN